MYLGILMLRIIQLFTWIEAVHIFSKVWEWTPSIIKSFTIKRMETQTNPEVRLRISIRPSLISSSSSEKGIEFLFYWISSTKMKSEMFFCSQLTTKLVRPNEADMFNGRTSLLKDYQTKDWESQAFNIKAQSGRFIITILDSN